MQRVLVCGATGFIGRNLVELLARRADLEIHGTWFSQAPSELPGVRWHEADLRRSDHVARLMPGFDIVVQAAATTSGARDIVERPHIHTTDNSVMNALLLRAAYEAKVGHFIFFSCSVMYPSSARPLKEEDWDANRPMEPRYEASGWTKIHVEKMCEFYARLGVTRHTVIRHSNIYGPHDKFDLEKSHVFGATVTKAMTAADAITVWGTGEERRDLLYVGDLVEFVERAIDRQTRIRSRFTMSEAGGRSASTSLPHPSLRPRAGASRSGTISPSRPFRPRSRSIAARPNASLAGGRAPN